MCALLLNIGLGDEVIMPSFTFVSTALAFVRQGAVIRFIDSQTDFPGMDEAQIEACITSRTRVLVVVHYAGIACDMDRIMELAQKYQLSVVEDAAQCIDSFYHDRPLGGIGHLGCFSFHETKNIHCGEGGMLVVNDERFVSRAEKIWEKGTNRADFFRRDVAKYEWVEKGSSFLPSDILAALLFAQLQHLDEVQQKRIAVWNRYNHFFKSRSFRSTLTTPSLPAFATLNGHLYWLELSDSTKRNECLEYLKTKGIHAVFHYQALHASVYYRRVETNIPGLPEAEKFSERLIRLPLFYDLSFEEVDYICKQTEEFLNR